MGVPIVNATGVMLPVDAADALLFLVENCAVVVCASPTPAHHGLLWGAMSAGVSVVMAEGNPLGQLWAGWRLPVVMYGGSGGVVGTPSSVTPDLLYWGWWEKLARARRSSTGWVVYCTREIERCIRGVQAVVVVVSISPPTQNAPTPHARPNLAPCFAHANIT